MTHVDLWFAYECAARACPSRRPGLSGCVLDVRLPVEPPQDGSAPEAPEVHCPACGEAMHFRDLWAADPAGYGGRGCGGGFRLPLEAAVAQQRWHEEHAATACGTREDRVVFFRDDWGRVTSIDGGCDLCGTGWSWQPRPDTSPAAARAACEEPLQPGTCPAHPER